MNWQAVSCTDTWFHVGRTRLRHVGIVALLLCAVSACSETKGRPGDTAGARAGDAKPGADVGAAAITPQMIALGNDIFHGKVGGGTCLACHGPDAKGTTLAPNLADTLWHHGDGSYQFIVNTVTEGVAKPMQYPAPMPPKGGAPLTAEQVRAVAAYVYSLSRAGS